MNLSDELRDLFREIFNIGVGRAAAGVAELLNYKIDLQIPSLYFLDQELIEEYMKQSKEKSVCVIQNISGDMQGIGALSFPLVKGKTLVDNILDSKLNKPQFGAVEIEAIQEIGNIVINAIGGAFANIIGLRLTFEPPTVVFLDYPIPPEISSKPNNFLYTIASTSLGVKEIDVEGSIMLIFAYSNIEIIERFIQSKKILSTKFGEILLEEHFVSRSQLEEAIKLQRDSKKFIGELMVDCHFITAEQRDSVLSHQKYKNCRDKFGEMVLKDNLITPEELAELLRIQKHSRSLIGEILIALKFIDEKTKDKTLSIQTIRKRLS